jgi:hypothetical protein
MSRLKNLVDEDSDIIGAALRHPIQLETYQTIET